MKYIRTLEHIITPERRNFVIWLQQSNLNIKTLQYSDEQIRSGLSSIVVYGSYNNNSQTILNELGTLYGATYLKINF